MKTLDLNAYGVSEMNAAEMRQTDGGIFPLVICGVVITAKAAAWIAGGCVAAGIFGAGVYVGYQEAANN
ncbi:MAG: class IIb bacteriocin, lactobin A/cerein 7B family [Bacteroidales bacterium]|jgi:lactobin A/cerein 7B family class IIb bacteriocin|nr:class IIb bacteriocin, lactobin A/cerein 7B family [Bacteroidales bacterium]